MRAQDDWIAFDRFREWAPNGHPDDQAVVRLVENLQEEIRGLQELLDDSEDFEDWLIKRLAQRRRCRRRGLWVVEE